MAAPATPANLAITETGSNAIHLSWDNVAGEIGFILYRSEDDITYNGLLWIEADTLTYWDGELDSLTAYYYKISAYNLDGESALSAAVNDTTLDREVQSLEYGPFGNMPYDSNSLYKGEDNFRDGVRTDFQASVNTIPFRLDHLIRYRDLFSIIFETTEDIDDTDSPYTITDNRLALFVDTDSGPVTVNMQKGVVSMMVKIINCGTSSNDITLTPYGTEEVWGGGAGVSKTLIDGDIIELHFSATQGWW